MNLFDIIAKQKEAADNARSRPCGFFFAVASFIKQDDELADVLAAF